jgi:hypothetical protein
MLRKLLTIQILALTVATVSFAAKPKAPGKTVKCAVLSMDTETVTARCPGGNRVFLKNTLHQKNLKVNSTIEVFQRTAP